MTSDRCCLCAGNVPIAMKRSNIVVEPVWLYTLCQGIICQDCADRLHEAAERLTFEQLAKRILGEKP